jgi:hypothetical protein
VYLVSSVIHEDGHYPHDRVILVGSMDPFALWDLCDEVEAADELVMPVALHVATDHGQGL